jgi:hypothetical protein
MAALAPAILAACAGPTIPPQHAAAQPEEAPAVAKPVALEAVSVKPDDVGMKELIESFDSVLKSKVRDESVLFGLAGKAAVRLEHETDPELRVFLLLVVAVSQCERKDWKEALRTVDQIEKESAKLPDESREDQDVRSMIPMVRALVLDSLGRRDESYVEMDRVMQAKPEVLRSREGRLEYAGGRASGPFTLPRTYAGKYSGDRRLPEAMARLESSWNPAVARIRRRLGSSMPELPPVVALVLDGEGSDLDYTMETNWREVKGRTVGIICVAAEDQVTDSCDVVFCMAHELAHVLHGAGGGLVGGTPLWLAEGLADWAGADDETELRDMVLSWSIRERDEDPRPPISVLLTEEATLEVVEETGQRVAGTVVFFQLERILGEDGLRRLILRLFHDRDWRKVLEEETKRSVPDLLKEVLAGYMGWTGRVFADRAVLDSAARMAKAGQLAKALDVLDRFVAGNPESPIRILAELKRAAGLAESGDVQGGLTAYEALGKRFRRSWFRCEPFYAELDILQERGEWGKAAVLGRTLLRDYLWSPSDAEVRKAMQEMLRRAEVHLATDGKPQK